MAMKCFNHRGMGRGVGKIDIQDFHPEGTF
jgi:hypothetical protein